MGRVISDGVAELQEKAVVGWMDALIRLGVAVLETHEGELARRPRDIDRATADLGGDGLARLVDHEIGEALASLLAADSRPPRLRQAVLERSVFAVLLADVVAARGRPLLDVLALQDPA